MVKKKGKKEELVVYTGENWSLIKDGLNISLSSAAGFYNEKRDNAKVKLLITAEEA